MTSPAFTTSPSRTVISRIRPEVLDAMAESSPSIRPLTAITPGGRAGGASRNHQAATPAPISSRTMAAARISRRRGRPAGASWAIVSRGGSAGTATTRTSGGGSIPRGGGEPVNEELLDMRDILGGSGCASRGVLLGEHARPETLGGEEEEE